MQITPLYNPIHSRSQSGFTLFELLVVILLISIVYTLFIQNLDRVEQNSEVKLTSLRSYLGDFTFEKRAEVICRGFGCNDCRVYIDGKEQERRLNLFTQEPRVYRYMPGGLLEKKEFAPIYVNEYKQITVCFKYGIRPNGSGDFLLMEHGEYAYLFKPYFEGIERFETLELAKDRILDQKDSIRG